MQIVFFRRVENQYGVSDKLPYVMTTTNSTTFTDGQKIVYPRLKEYFNGNTNAVSKVIVKTKKLKDAGFNDEFLKGENILSKISVPVQVLTNTNSTTNGLPILINY
jgi:hypothetical protein